MEVQFQELLVKLFHKLIANGHDVGMHTVIIVDGLDERSRVRNVILESLRCRCSCGSDDPDKSHGEFLS